MRRSQAAPEPRTITPGEAPGPGIGELDDADIDVALLEDAVVGEQLLEIVATLRNGSQNAVDVVDQLCRQVLMHAADRK